MTPYDVYIGHLLDVTLEIDAKDCPLAVHDAILNAPKGSKWTVWIGEEVRNRFIDCKQQMLPNGTHGQFIALLLALKDEHSRRSLLDPLASSQAQAQAQAQLHPQQHSETPLRSQPRPHPPMLPHIPSLPVPAVLPLRYPTRACS
eukprot:jgi/Hompol1/2541/HPOL_006042-RA